MKNINNFSVLVVIVFFLVGYFLIGYTVPKYNLKDIKEIVVAGQSIKVELAMTPAEQGSGLSGREQLKDDEGMLFVFEHPGNYSFWMKDMNFPIDMIWLGENLKVVYIKKDAQPESYPETYAPQGFGKNAKYVLEITSGFSEKNNLKEGDRVTFTY